MNKWQRRRRIGLTLKGYRLVSKQTAEETARELGWPLVLYLQVEGAVVSLSAGQQEDVRKLFKGKLKRCESPETHYAGGQCGVWDPGDRLASAERPDLVTCGKCKLMPAWLDAARGFSLPGPDPYKP